MGKKLLLCDLDGTLCFHDHIEESDLEAIERFKQAGNLIGVNTGRAYSKAITGADFKGKRLDFDLTFAESSTVVKNGKDEVVESHPLDMEVIESITRSFPEVKKVLTVEGEYCVLKDNGTELAQDWISHIYDDLSELSGKRVHTISIKNESEKDAVELARKIHELNIPVETGVNTRYIDVTAKGYNKAQAIRAAEKLTGIPSEDIYAIGDSWNDLPALLAAGKGFLMNSASDSLKKEARQNRIIQVDSVAEAIDRILKEDSDQAESVN